MNDKNLSDRIRPKSEAAPWVIEDVKRLEKENQELRQCLLWYVQNDETNEGGKWEEANSHWLEGKRRAMRALGMEEE
jgi:hypothetical protein